MFYLLNKFFALFFSQLGNIELHYPFKRFPWQSKAGKEVNYDSGENVFFSWKIINMLLKILGLKLWDQPWKMITLAILIKILIRLHFKKEGGGSSWVECWVIVLY